MYIYIYISSKEAQHSGRPLQLENLALRYSRQLRAAVSMIRAMWSWSDTVSVMLACAWMRVHACTAPMHP